MGGKFGIKSTLNIRNFHTTRALSADIYTLTIELTEVLRLSIGYYEMAIDTFDFANSMSKEYRIEFGQNFTSWDEGLENYQAVRWVEVEEAKNECLDKVSQATTKFISGQWMLDDLKAKDPNCLANNSRIFQLLQEATARQADWKALAARTDWAM